MNNSLFSCKDKVISISSFRYVNERINHGDFVAANIMFLNGHWVIFDATIIDEEYLKNFSKYARH